MAIVAIPGIEEATKDNSLFTEDSTGALCLISDIISGPDDPILEATLEEYGLTLEDITARGWKAKEAAADPLASRSVTGIYLKNTPENISRFSKRSSS